MTAMLSRLALALLLLLGLLPGARAADTIDPAVLEPLVRAGLRLFPGLDGATFGAASLRRQTSSNGSPTRRPKLSAFSRF